MSNCATRTPEQELEYIRQVLREPISQDLVANAKQQDNQFLQTKTVRGVQALFLTDERYSRLFRILDKITQGQANKFALRIVDTSPKIENAFVNGSNFIYVYTGLIDNAKSDDELAFTLSHELAHTRLRHLQRQDNTYAEIASIAVQYAAKNTRDINKRENYQMASEAISNVYSRDHEREADALAVIWANKAGYNPAAAVNFFNRMIAQEAQYKVQAEREQQEIASKIQEFSQTCQTQTQQLQVNSNLRTIQNQQAAQDNCNKAKGLQDELRRIQRNDYKMAFARSHPSNQERINYINTLNDYFNCRATEQQLTNTGRGWYLFKAIQYKRNC